MYWFDFNERILRTTHEEKTPGLVLCVFSLVKERPRIVTVDLHHSCWHEISEQMDGDWTFGGILKNKQPKKKHRYASCVLLSRRLKSLRMILVKCIYSLYGSWLYDIDIVIMIITHLSENVFVAQCNQRSSLFFAKHLCLLCHRSGFSLVRRRFIFYTCSLAGGSATLTYIYVYSVSNTLSFL